MRTQGNVEDLRRAGCVGSRQDEQSASHPALARRMVSVRRVIASVGTRNQLQQKGGERDTYTVANYPRTALGYASSLAMSDELARRGRVASRRVGRRQLPRASADVSVRKAQNGDVRTYVAVAILIPRMRGRPGDLNHLNILNHARDERGTARRRVRCEACGVRGAECRRIVALDSVVTGGRRRREQASVDATQSRSSSNEDSMDQKYYGQRDTEHEGEDVPIRPL